MTTSPQALTVQRTPPIPATLYEADETGWLEANAELIRVGRLDGFWVGDGP